MIRFLSTKFNKPVKFSHNLPREYSENDKQTLLSESHSGHSTQHFGENRTLTRLKETHDWKHIEQDVKEFINRCDICQREKLTRIRQKGEAVITDRNQREGCPRYIRTLA